MKKKDKKNITTAFGAKCYIERVPIAVAENLLATGKILGYTVQDSYALIYFPTK